MSEQAYILLFRGINVGGNKIVKMELLREALTNAGFDNVKTYIQSGNVVMKSGMRARQVEAIVERVFPETFGFTSRSMVVTLFDLRQIIIDNPFEKASDIGKRVHAVFLDSQPTDSAMDALRELASTEELVLGDGVLYLHTPDGFGTSKVAAALDKLLKVPLTARNWNTVVKLHEMAEAANW